MKTVLITLFVVLYNLAFLAGTVWLVGWHDWSPWWFVFTGAFLLQTKKAD